MIKMKALRSFGVAGANEGKVKRGREFSVASEHRVRDLENHGLAYRIDEAPARPRPAEIAEIVQPSNKAAAAGPLDSPGGTIGAEAPAPSSQADRQPRRRRSMRSKEEDLLS